MMEALSFRRVVANKIDLKEASSSPVRIDDRSLTSDGILINTISGIGIAATQNTS
jgi:hypothetical protein